MVFSAPPLIDARILFDVRVSRCEEENKKQKKRKVPNKSDSIMRPFKKKKKKVWVAFKTDTRGHHLQHMYKGLIDFKGTTVWKAFILAALSGAAITWVSTVSTVLIHKKLIERQAQTERINGTRIGCLVRGRGAAETQALFWLSSFVVCMSTTMVVYVGMYVLFGYGSSMLVNSPKKST